MFKHYLEEVDRRNALDSTALHGITKFADLSMDEFKAQFLNYKVNSKVKTEKVTKAIAKYQGTWTFIDSFFNFWNWPLRV